ncbi:Fungal specific transcription factor domain [Rhizoctonia solani]|uniref:Fungal specific transcription factor domain n=1 Tax=Rhizoctonia solani TaxID=456999 RepID=A0A8H8P620_9AGAM|nr:Fungal specific transcription factor domain [Rhizoctonia solani]QRW25915.1 Fungal specific transcription factor domain [Rhizoctonia solani]
MVHSTIKNSSLSDLADRLMAQLELTYLGFIAAGSTLGYQLLQKALPGFLRLVAADPNLVAEQPDGGLLVSFPRAFGTSLQEIKRFIIYDMATGFLLGVPPLLEYDYYGKCDPVSHGSEWIHGVPVPLVEIISQINSWRAGFKVPLDDWQILESRVMVWEVQPLPIEDGDSRMNVARLAIQEGWRHVVLIYIYMGICGVSSHDSRVQASIAQIIQLEGIVAGLPISIHMLMHYVVAGMGARYEQQRSIIRQKLVSFKGKGAWLFQGPEFTQILDHLWHGAGAGGAPVMWDDYVQSRCTVIHI